MKKQMVSLGMSFLATLFSTALSAQDEGKRDGVAGGAIKDLTAEGFVEQLMKLDTNKDGKLSKKEMKDDKVRHFFQKADLDGDELVTTEELTGLHSREMNSEVGGAVGQGGAGGFAGGGGKGGAGGKGGVGQGGAGGQGGSAGSGGGQETGSRTGRGQPGQPGQGGRGGAGGTGGQPGQSGGRGGAGGAGGQPGQPGQPGQGGRGGAGGAGGQPGQFGQPGQYGGRGGAGGAGGQPGQPGQAGMPGGNGQRFGSGHDGMGPPPAHFGVIMPPHVQDSLNLSVQQRRQIAELQAMIDNRLSRILNDDQEQQYDELRNHNPGPPNGQPEQPMRGDGRRDGEGEPAQQNPRDGETRR